MEITTHTCLLNKLTIIYIAALDKIAKTYQHQKQLYKQVVQLIPILKRETYLFVSTNGYIYTWDRYDDVSTAWKWYDGSQQWEPARNIVLEGWPLDWMEARMLAKKWHRSLNKKPNKRYKVKI
jgi:hypothetical protein